MKCLACLPNNQITLDVYVQPRASKNRVAGLHGSAIKLCVTAPPVDNRANEAVVALLADLLGLPKTSVSIKSGRQGRLKKVLLNNLSLQEAEARLARTLSHNQPGAS